MPNILIAILLLFSNIILSQSSDSISIHRLSKNINNLNSQFNFFQITKDSALYTSSELYQNKYLSTILSTKKIDKIWGKGVYIPINPSYSIGNIQIISPQEYYITICNEKNRCKIGWKTKDVDSIILIDKNINLPNTHNTHPHRLTINNQDVLYFSSNRIGGFGGMDIWFSIIDEFGNYGIPINAGNKINSNFDEITPFYNLWTNELFFSSNRGDSLKSFNIYKSKGNLNVWDDIIICENINSKDDDTYLRFYTKNSGHFSSNRSSILQKENCCNNIFHFKIYETTELDVDTNIYNIPNFNKKILKYLPIRLYFDNDKPDSKTMKGETKKDYKTTRLKYLKRKTKYLKKNRNKIEIENFFNITIDSNQENLNNSLEKISQSLNEGNKIELHVKGFASPLYKHEYNINLSKRRISSFKNLLFQYNNEELLPYIISGKLTIKESPLGETKSSKQVSDNPRNEKESIYSIDAMLERRIEIIKIIEIKK